MCLNDKYTPDFIAKMRSTRTVNNELENVLTAEYVKDWLYGDDEANADISDKQPIEEPEEQPTEEPTEEQPVESHEDNEPAAPSEEVADKADES